jgi:hypothetical protein
MMFAGGTALTGSGRAFGRFQGRPRGSPRLLEMNVAIMDRAMNRFAMQAG